MDQDLKQRLVGAVVITSLAAIFVPMLFDDPIDESGKMISELTIPKAPLNGVKSIPKSADDVMKLPESPALRQVNDDLTTDDFNQRWFIQVGIFSQKENAVSLQNKIRSQGFDVTIADVNNENGLLYRVRVGPVLTREKAEKFKAKVDQLNNIKGIISAVDE